MEDDFIITVNDHGKDRDFPATLRVMGYTHQFRVIVDGLEVLFERDEEGSYRAILPAGTDEKTRHGINVSLLQLISAKIESILE